MSGEQAARTHGARVWGQLLLLVAVYFVVQFLLPGRQR